MAYKINNTFGTLLVTLADGTIDTATTDLTLFGKGYAGFGEKLNENFVKVLENFNNTSAPTNNHNEATVLIRANLKKKTKIKFRNLCKNYSLELYL